MSRRWVLTKTSPELAETIASRHQLDPLIAQLLVNRGIDSDAAIRHHLASRLQDMPDPTGLPDMEAAVATLQGAIAQKKRIVLFGDYDVDGISGSSILWIFLTGLKAHVRVYIPDRQSEGYGLSIAALKKIHAEGCDLLITIDNGTQAFAELAWAREHGMEAIVIDHHESPTERPECAALINPKHPQSAYPDKTLCSAGLCFNLLVALRAALRKTGAFGQGSEPDLKPYLDLVALGTIADMVPLTGLNRLLTRYGLRVLSQGARPGIAALKEVSGIHGRSVGTFEVGFILAPRLNAAGRLAHARLGVELLTTEDLNRARQLAAKLQRLNQERRSIESEIVEQAIAQAEGQAPEESHRVIVVAGREWHPGVIGIVAAKLTERFQKPACVIALSAERGVGSARTFAGIDLYALLSKCAEQLIRFGGHQAAAGFTIQQDKVDRLRIQMQAAAAELFPDQTVTAILKLDDRLACHHLNTRMVDEIDRLAPFGVGNPEPLFLSEPIRFSELQIVGDNHLRATVQSGAKSLPAIAFRMAERYPELKRNSGHYELAYRPQWNEFRGEKNIQLVVQDIRSS